MSDTYKMSDETVCVLPGFATVVVEKTPGGFNTFVHLEDDSTIIPDEVEMSGFAIPDESSAGFAASVAIAAVWADAIYKANI